MRLPLLALALLCLLAGCVRSKPDTSEQIIAKVNGEPVPMKDLLVSFQQLRGEQDEISQKNPKLLEQLKTRALNEVIIMTLLRQESAKRKVHIAKEEVEGRLANWKDSYPTGGFEEMLRKLATTEDFLKKRIEDQLLIEKLTDELFGNETRVGDEEIKQYFKQHESEFVRAEKVHVFQILVPTKEEAEKIRQEIVSNKTTFESAALQKSLSPDSAKKGDLGFFGKNEKIAAFNEAFGLSVGAISKPIQSRYGFHLLRVVEKQPAKKLTLNDAKSDILKALKREKEIKIYKEWVAKLLKDGDILRNEALFANLS